MQIHGVNGAQSVQGPQQVDATRATNAAEQAAPTDQVEISAQAEMASQAAEMVDKIHQLPEIRADRVEEIKAAIEAGTYETLDKLDVAVDRLLDEIA
tara:strand:+ start:127 stop:417 length:291 start_codon:yes stop_codon:yes gene_type:complete